MINHLSKIYDFALSNNLDQSIDSVRKYKLFVTTCLFVTIFGFLYGVLSYFIGFEVGVWTMAVSVIFFTSNIFFLKYLNINTLGFLIGVYTIWLNATLVFYSGGLFASPVSPWITLTPPFVLLLTNRRNALIILFLCIFYVLGFYWMILDGYDFPKTYSDSFHLIFLVLAMMGLIVIFYLITTTFEALKQQALDSLLSKQKELKSEQKRSEDLLLNIFPKEIAEELKETGKAKARLHENVTVLFADIKNFTSLSEGLTPPELVKLLHAYFQRIDSIIQKHGLEKIKTIGDAYLAAGGVPGSNKANAINVVEAAIEIQETNLHFKNEQLNNGNIFFDFRIGINTGPVVAGVVGDKKFVYDIWGDAVNLAARIEETSEPGKINISESTYFEIKDHFICEPRGFVPAKNKGEIKMFWVHDVRIQEKSK
ncbi:adenylate/guanylate cyclase domain-containing protein [Aquiflexum lacus]|uniref:adenylate/guanylate cyclase domain-containing protein n=1 Tax=Aquiflexum lacus TaxID=2483805 RepID=UPI00189361F4|nr:adenylate/guanylate cyclase domain-containing protein [Aquiflexum lacus]